jgi:AcrR family transcriptional regulator
MSKLKMNTREKIVDQSLKLFNERGIEYVGLRELAAILDIRVGNISYYFPTKDDLVYELSQELSKANATLLRERESVTMIEFLKILHSVFLNHIKFRCLLLSVVHLMQQNKHLAAAYKKTQSQRYSTIHSNLAVLEKAGYLKIEYEEQMEFLVSNLSLVSRFWISEAAISFRQMTDGDQLRYYLKHVVQLFSPFATTKGKKDMQLFLRDL